jgi:hypothetical protein
LRENTVPPIVVTIDSFKEYLVNAIVLINQSAVPALQHGYSMTAVEDNALVTSYGDPLANFDATYAATQETMKNQADSLVAMQTHLQTFNSSAWPSANSPQAASTPPLSSNACSTTAINAAVAVKTAAVVSHNNQP